MYRECFSFIRRTKVLAALTRKVNYGPRELIEFNQAIGNHLLSADIYCRGCWVEEETLVFSFE